MVGMCIMCEGNDRDDVLFHLDAAIDRFGWVCQAVEGHDPPDLDWVYTVGLAGGFDHPELVALGDIPSGAEVLNELGALVRSGRRLAAGERIRTSSGVVTLGRVHPDHLTGGLVAVWVDYYGSLGPPFPEPEVLQVIRPDPSCCAEHRFTLPLLSDPKAELVRTLPPGPNRAERRAQQRATRQRGR